jgi:signal transduction histidine kinase/CheY-like chemotaxis protein
MDEILLTLKVLIKRNILQLIYIFVAFFLMVLLGSVLVNRILRSRLLEGAESALLTAESNIKSGLAEAEITLLNSYHVVSTMIRDGATQEEIKLYLSSTSEWMRQREEGLFDFSGIYGYIRGEFIDGINLNPDSNYIPQMRPWFQTAVRSGSALAFTRPYRDERSGETKISAVHSLEAPDGTFYGVLAVDVNIARLNEYVRSLRLAPGGYGLTLSRSMVIMNHPEMEFLGLQLQEMGGDFAHISRALVANEDVYGEIIRDRDGVKLIVFFSRMFNGWYVGLITPYDRFFRDLVYAAVALSQLGIILAVVLGVVLLRINAARMKSDEENRQKSTFLAQMSHEIRTPMNAIIGISEITLREEISGKVAENIASIKQAGNNLLAIINDILDFSRIESGKLEIVPTEYLFSSLINDCISIIRTRLVDRPVRLITRIDGTLPSRLYGDEVRMRQILLNLLSNAVKYTNEGSIIFSVKSETGAVSAGDSITIIFEVVDTGIGIKKENMEKLFGQFTRFAENESQHVEGTGLGLAITRNLCQLMGGTVAAKSEYGKGSVFTAALPQVVRDAAPLAAVENPETKKVLVFEKRKEYAEALIYSIGNFNVACTLAESRADFIVELINGEFQFILVSSACIRDGREILEDISISRNQNALLVLLADYGEDVEQENIRTLFQPFQPQALAQLLNNEQENAQDSPLFRGSGVRFTAPECRILIVDDVYSNLVVAEGLLAPYKVQVDSCQSGSSSIMLAEKYSYDIIFMDHMMPGMDGIEAAARIRKSEGSRALSPDQGASVPIVALTANAVSGMKEMFLENGFSDYLSKPIDLAKLDEILLRWLPPKKQLKQRPRPVKIAAAPEISSNPALMLLFGIGVNTLKGISLSGGGEKDYFKVLNAFHRDVLDRLDLLDVFFTAAQSALAGGAAPEPDQLNLFVVSVHALKSASGTIGAEELSREAAEIESAGKAGDLKLITGKFPAFRKRLADIADTLTIILGMSRNSGQSEEAGGEEFIKARPLFESLREALAVERINDIDSALNAIEELNFTGEIMDEVAKISDLILISEFAEARNLIQTLLRKQESPTPQP